jgi:ABC-type bacteriocin/lantibiotic exporter with double-glycine peptidase domain
MRRRVPWIAQTQLADCGPASLAIVLAFHGRRVALEDIRRLCAGGSGSLYRCGIIGSTITANGSDHRFVVDAACHPPLAAE